MSVNYWVACLCLGLTSQASALTYDQALDYAVGYDKKYASAILEMRSAQYLPTIARASLLPKVTMTGFQANNNLTQNGLDPFGNISTTTQNYTAKSYVGQMTQPLINLAAIASYLQSAKQEKAARQKLGMELNDLKNKVIEAYCSLASAQEAYADTEKELGTLIEQEKIAIAKQFAGASSKTDVEEITYAKLQTQANLDDAKSALLQAKISLEALMGGSISMKELLGVPQIYLPPGRSLNTLIDDAKETNPKVGYQQSSYESALYENKKNKAAYIPTVDIVAYQGYQNSNTLSTVGQKSTQGYLGLQLNIPVFTGGETYGKERQSAFYAESQRLLLESEKNDVEASVRKLYSQAEISSQKLATLAAQTETADRLYLSFLKQHELGLKSTYDLLVTLRRKFQSERDLSKTKYERVQILKKLEVTVGDIHLTGNSF